MRTFVYSRRVFNGADLDEATLTGTRLRGANLSRANLSGAEHLTQEELEEAFRDEHTQLPAGLKLPAHWGVKTDEQTGGE
jgi:hypothetical protein